ncbi:PREDICTED: coiled-coil domain-containing protein 50 [Phaethon lepturus]|nr:PREDICTED: coiled-coil domain-containing protein 50 [Phaethon lepturus]
MKLTGDNCKLISELGEMPWSKSHGAQSAEVHRVCRDFAVLEDHTLAHNLQEQEIEHHLATNVQRNRLVQHDLQVAKQLQEEEDLKARAQIQKHRKDLERQDCEIAQEIQVKLVFEAEQRRRQEEKDEDIARLLQQKELQEEKKRKKQYTESQGHTLYEDSYYAENGGAKLRGTKQAAYDTPRREQELSDAEIARKLQEEELLDNEADQKAAQVAQDEEIARLLMAEEKKAFKKGKEREKSSFEKRRHDQDWKHDASESTRSRSKEGPETQRHKGDRSSRSQPLLDDLEHARYSASQPSPLRQIPKPEHSPKGDWQSSTTELSRGKCPVPRRKERSEGQGRGAAEALHATAALLAVPGHAGTPLPRQDNHAVALSATTRYCQPPAMAAVTSVVTTNPSGGSGGCSACAEPRASGTARLRRPGLVRVLEDSAALAARHWELELGMGLLETGGSIRKVRLLHPAGDHRDSARRHWGPFKRCSSPWPMLSPLGACPATLDNVG